ncbi:hypothetical protein [Haliovirga abyssi]|uniref:Amino acid transport protein n=1 Tax=Haliovirga abyssi TaxID=2996794 RepID=A0AAU9D6W0_9FUSO|nr:hypothetical protein [Haliovirga abyssi]BDU51709.1 hypothetical protein HLVA_22780 [Haliovirga abyssi]
MTLLISFIISTIGLGYFMYGKKSYNSMFLVIGIILMAYPYFIQNIMWMLIVGVILAIIPFKI